MSEYVFVDDIWSVLFGKLCVVFICKLNEVLINFSI